MSNNIFKEGFSVHRLDKKLHENMQVITFNKGEQPLN